MSYQEKRTITSIISGLLVLAAYCIYAFVIARPEVGDIRFWAVTMLIFIGVGIGVTVVIQIIFHIMLSIGIAVKERAYDEKKVGKSIEAAVVEDEMDKLIELKSLRVSFVIVGIAFVAGLILLTLGGSAALMLNMLFLGSSFGSVVEGLVSLRYYRKGVRNA